jgi:hypothetical protein
MNLKKLNLGIQFEMKTFPEKELDPNDPSLKWPVSELSTPK